MTKYIDAGDRDFDKEPVIAPDGTELTQEYFEELADQAEAQQARAGRPSLSGGSKHSPQVAARVSESTKAKLEAKAEADGKSISEVVRDAIEAYV